MLEFLLECVRYMRPCRKLMTFPSPTEGAHSLNQLNHSSIVVIAFCTTQVREEAARTKDVENF